MIGFPARSDAASKSARVADSIRTMIHDGRLRAGDTLPSTRALAAELGVARGTVVTAFEQLDGEGYIVTRHGAAARVAATLAAAPAPTPIRTPSGTQARPTRSSGAAGPSAPARPTPARDEARPLIELLPGVPDSAAISQRDWRAAWRHAAAAPLPDGYPDPLGETGLRAQIASQLGFSRGFAPAVDRVMVTAGTREAVSLVAEALGAGARVAVENPGHRGGRQILRSAGADLVPIGLDEHGLRLDELAAAHDRAPLAGVLVTPSHQYPMGVVMPIARRHELLAWAQAHGVVVVEDDYDSEFRHHGAPLPALAAIDTAGVVVHVGTFSKTVSPALRCGHLITPEAAPIADALRRARDARSATVAVPTQAAVEWLMSTGALRRHVARLRRDYTHKRALLADALTGLPDVTVGGLAGGLHAVVQWKGSREEGAVVAGIRRRGVAVAPLSQYVVESSGLEVRGLVIGYGPVPATTLAGGLLAVAAELDGTRGGTSRASGREGSARTHPSGEMRKP